MEETEVKNVLADLQWQAEILAGSRVVRGRTAIFRARASTPPKQDIVRLLSGNEVITMHITTPLKKKHEPSKAKDDEPETWQQAMRSSLGKTTLPVTTQQPQPSRKHPRQEEEHQATWAERLQANQADEHMNDSSESEMD